MKIFLDDNAYLALAVRTNEITKVKMHNMF